MEKYNTFLIVTMCVGGYLISEYLVKIGKINKAEHRKFWNMVLAISFLVSGVFGLVLAVLLDEEIVFGGYLQMLNLHVRLGIIMTTVGLIHLIWHIRYYFPKKIV